MKLYLATVRQPDMKILAVSNNKKKALEAGWKQVKEFNRIDKKFCGSTLQREKADIKIITMETI